LVIDGSAQDKSPLRFVEGDAGIVAGSYVVSSQGLGFVEKEVKLDVLVALDAWIRGPALEILLDEIAYNPPVEDFSKVEDIVRYAELLGHLSGILYG